jgi:hypothetical protein
MSMSTPASPEGSSSLYPIVLAGFADPNMAMLQHAHYVATYGLMRSRASLSFLSS